MVEVKDIIDNPAIFAYTITIARCFSLVTYPQFRSLSKILIFIITSIFFRRQLLIFLKLLYVFCKINPVVIIALFMNMLTVKMNSYKTKIIISILILWFVALFETEKDNNLKNDLSDFILKSTEGFEKKISFKKLSVQEFTVVMKFKIICAFTMTLLAYTVLKNKKTDLLFYEAGLVLFPTEKDVRKSYVLGVIVSLFVITMYFVR